MLPRPRNHHRKRRSLRDQRPQVHLLVKQHPRTLKNAEQSRCETPSPLVPSEVAKSAHSSTTHPSDEQFFAVTPTGFVLGDAIYEDLYEVVLQYWKEEYSDVYDSLLGISIWQSQLATLGFDTKLINAADKILQSLRDTYGPAVINQILRYEPVSAIANVLLQAEVEYYSDRITRGFTLGYHDTMNIQIVGTESSSQNRTSRSSSPTNIRDGAHNRQNSGQGRRNNDGNDYSTKYDALVTSET